MPKTKTIDHLTSDVLAAEAAGMSYGKWKATHPHTLAWAGIEADAAQAGKIRHPIVCPGCGVEFIPPEGHSNRKYCDDLCRKRAAERRYLAKHPRKTLTCVVCGKSMKGQAGRMYCSDACSLKAFRQRKAATKEVAAI